MASLSRNLLSLIRILAAMSFPPEPETDPLSGGLCRSRNLATLFLVTLSVIGLTYYLAAASEWSWTASDNKDQAKSFLMLHDQVPFLAERLHRKALVTFIGFLWPIFAYLVANSRSLIRLLLRPYILLSGVHLAGWITAMAILGPGAVVLFELFISVLRVAQLQQLLVSSSCVARYRGGASLHQPPLHWEIQVPFLHRQIELQLPGLEVAPSPEVPRGDLRLAFAFALRQPWSIVGLLIMEFVLWSANALLLGWHVMNTLWGIAGLNAP